MSVIIKGNNAFDMSIASNIKDVESQHIKFQNIYFKCKSIEDAGGTIFVKRKKGKWIDTVIKHDSGELPIQVCDQCNTFFPLAYTGGGHKFCPNCGADMRCEEMSRNE